MDFVCWNNKLLIIIERKMDLSSINLILVRFCSGPAGWDPQHPSQPAQIFPNREVRLLSFSEKGPLASFGAAFHR